MEPVPVGGGGIRATPLAFESFGARSMATFVETDDVKILVDPGAALGQRFSLAPHPKEYLALVRAKQRIQEAGRRADVITVSHYHFDHYTPNFEDWGLVWSSPEMAERLYRGKMIMAKDTSSNINPSQRKRGYMFWKLNSRIADMKSADGQKFEFGGTRLEFSKPVSHGPEGAEIGYVLMLSVKTEDAVLVHASDVQGPIERGTLQLILNENPSAVILGGPPLYLQGFRVEPGDMARALENIKELVSRVPLVVVDHHLLRSLDYLDFLKPAASEAEKKGHRLSTASELVGHEPQLLEARRRELHANEPVERGWYSRLEKGEFKEGLQLTSAQERPSP
ncbi:MAG: MBL fold metallo-hydrolase [Candidatus Hadarchaeota archaeon]